MITPPRKSLFTFQSLRSVFQPVSSVLLGHRHPVTQTFGVKHLENDLNPVNSQPISTCHKESLKMIFLHVESQFSNKEKISHTHTHTHTPLVKKY